MAKILVTGATGFVGKQLIPALIAAGHEVRCAVSRKVDWLSAEQVVVNKLEDQPQWDEALAGINVVIHLAARVHIMHDNAESAFDDYCKINSVATRNLATEAAKNRVQRFIFLSSIKVHGEETHNGVAYTEDSLAQPEDAYGQSKLYAEHYLQEISQNTGMEVVIIRPPLVYGAEVKANFLKMMQIIQKGWPLPFACAHNKRNLVYIDNLVSALCCVAEHPDAANQTYLVADNEALSLAQLMTAIGNEMQVKMRLFPVPVALMKWALRILGMKKLNTRLFGSLEVSTDKIKSQLGWVPPVCAAEGVRETVKWYQCDSRS